MAGSPERLSSHFTLAEMIESGTARRDPELWRRQCAPPAEVENAMRRLAANTLQPLRDLFNWPILVNSGYRCMELNRRIGGAYRSQHCRGEAADIRLAAGWTIDRTQDELALQRVSEDTRGRVEALTPNGWLFAVAAELMEQLDVDQVIHEHGDRFGAPAWVHISHGPRRRRKLLAIGSWPGGVYRSCASLAEMADMAEGAGW